VVASKQRSYEVGLDLVDFWALNGGGSGSSGSSLFARDTSWKRTL
jgi:hypothetical protein